MSATYLYCCILSVFLDGTDFMEKNSETRLICNLISFHLKKKLFAKDFLKDVFIVHKHSVKGKCDFLWDFITFETDSLLSRRTPA